jgi:P-type Cu+ transporter
MLVKPGEKIPTDGWWWRGKQCGRIHGHRRIPACQKAAGDEVIGSTINKQGVLRVEATRVGKDTFLAQVIKLVEECQGSKVPIQEFADRVTGLFRPLVILIALGAFRSWMLFPDFHLGVEPSSTSPGAIPLSPTIPWPFWPPRRYW